jgi:predicted helicase
LFGDDGENNLIRHDGISDYILNVARKKYDKNVTKEDIFYYVYGYLHSPEYRESFSDDLKLSLPKIGLVDDYDEFKTFSVAGRNLADLHLNYEGLEPPSTVKLSGDQKVEDILKNLDICRVKKMKLIPEKRKLIYNQYITIENIPEEAFDFVINGRSALGWIVEQYQYSVDKASGIINDPNEYAGGAYILKLVLSIISVSMKTMDIVKNIPKLSFETENSKGDP